VALQWFRKHQKRVLYPLTAVVVVTFVFLWGGSRRGRAGRGGEVVAEVGGEPLTRAQQFRLLNIVRRLRQAMAIEADELAPIRYLMRARAARDSGIQVSREQLQDVVRGIMSSDAWLGSERFTEAEYRSCLSGYNIAAVEFESFLEDVLAGDLMTEAVVRTAYLTEQERYLAYCRERDRIRLRTRDFPVKDHEKDAPAPTDDDLRKYYDENKDLDPESELALATEAEVALEYCFADGKASSNLLNALRAAEPVGAAACFLAGPGPGLASVLGSSALAAAREKDLRDRYEAAKAHRFRLPPEPPKKSDAASPAAPLSSGAPRGGGTGLGSMLALPALGAAAPGETQGPPGPKGPASEVQPGSTAAPQSEPPQERYRPFEEVRAELEKELSESESRAASRRRADEVRTLAARWARPRAVGVDALLAGLSPGAAAAAAALHGTADRIELALACERSGVAFGRTERKKASELKSWPPLGELRGLAERALSTAKRSRSARRPAEPLGAIQRPAVVENGWASWRVAEYLPPRTLTFDEAKETIRKRIVHARSAELARKAAEKFRSDLESGKVDVGQMVETPPLAVTTPRARPFALLGVGEVCAEPVAVRSDRPDEALPEEESARLERVGLYRVAVVTDRISPSLEDFRKDKAWLDSNIDRLQRIQMLFLREHWVVDEVRRKVELRLLQPLSERPHRHEKHEGEEAE